MTDLQLGKAGGKGPGSGDTTSFASAKSLIYVIHRGGSTKVALRPSLDRNIDTSTIIQCQTVWSLISCKRLTVVSEFEVFLVQTTTLGKNGEHDSEGALVSQGEVGLFSSIRIPKEDGDGLVASRGAHNRGGRLGNG